MHPIQALLLKEIRQHRWILLALTGALAMALGVEVWSAGRAARVLSLLDAARPFLQVFIPLAGIVLSHRLIVQEYQGRTHAFLEGLPISRAYMVATKFALGLVYLVSTAVAAVIILALLAAGSEPIGATFLTILILKSSSYVFFVWAVLFAMSFSGHFRIAIYIGSLLGLIYLTNNTSLDLMEVGPFALLNPQTFALERQEFAWGLLIQTNLIGLGFSGLAFFLALVREGTVVEALSRKMTHREKATVAMLALAALAILAILDEKQSKEPYRFQSKSVVRSESQPISIMYSVDWAKPDAEQLLAHLERSLGSMVDTLGIDQLPPTRIAPGYPLDERTFETAVLENNDGLLIRANYREMSEQQRGDLVAYIIRGVLDHTTRKRSRFEAKRWLHDGFSRWWATHGLDEADEIADPVLVARARVALRYIDDFPELVPRWTYLREQIGEPLAEALAYCAVKMLEENAGRDAVLRLAKSILGRSPPEDARELLYEWSHPMAMVFSESTGGNWETFPGAWKEWVTVHAQDDATAEVLARVPFLTGSVEIHAREGAIREIAGHFSVVGGDTAPRAECVILHRKLSPFDDELHPKTLLREERDCATDLPSIKLTGRYGPGERVFTALEFGSPALGVSVRISARRIVIQ